MLALDDIEPSDAAADVDADPFGNRLIDFELRALGREVAGRDGESPRSLSRRAS